MDDNKKSSPVDSDSALVSDDPQAQVAGQGWNYIDPLGKAYGALKEGQQNAKQFDTDLSGSVQSMKDLARTGVASNPEADMALAAHTNGMAMGTLKGDGKAKPQATYGKTTPDLTHMEMKSPHIDHSTQRRLHTEYAQTAEANGDLELAEKHNKMARMHDYYDTAQYFGPDAYRKRENYSDVKEGRKLYIDKAKSLYDELNAKPKPLPMDEGKAPKFKITAEDGYTHLNGPGVKATANSVGSDYGWWLQNEEHNLPYENPAILENLQVEKSAQGKGLGSSALQQLEKNLKKQGHDSVLLTASPLPDLDGLAKDESKLNDLVKFYEKHGYETYEAGDGGYTMHKDLTKKAKSGKLSYADGGQVQHYDEGTPVGGAQVQGVAPSVPVVDNALAPQADPQQSRSHVLDPDGEMWTIDNSELGSALKAGYTTPQPEQVAQYEREKKYGSTGQQVKAGLEGIAQGVAGPIAPMVERGLGVKPEDILGRAETNPLTHFAGQVGGLLSPSGEGALLSKAGSGVAKLIHGADEAGQAIKATTLAGRIGTGAAKSAVENMMLAGSDEASRMMLQDPSQSAQTAMVDIGLSGVLGGALGGTMSAVSPLWKASVGNKLGQTIEDFKGRIQEHINNPNPVDATTEELKNYYGNIKGMADEVYGPQGLKSQDVAKALPISVTPEITEQNQQVFNALKGTIDDMVGKEGIYPKRLVSKLQGDLESYAQRVSSDDVTERFNATQDLKQQLQSYAKFDKFVKPVDEAYDFVAKAKNLSHDLRQKLEDPKVWGKAAERQQSINKAFQQYLPALKDFEKRFTTKILGESEIDPAKISTYINQIGRPNAEIKQEMLKNFLDASAKYQKVLHDTHLNLGMESPVVNSSLSSTMSTLGKKTTGAKLADMFIEKGLTDAGGKSIGAGIGGGLGHATGGHEAIGALLGAHTLGPFFSSVLPAIVKPIIEKIGSSSGMKAATDFGVAVAKGEGLMTRAAKNVLRVGTEVLSSAQMPTERARNKLDKILKGLQVDPSPLLTQKNDTDHYLPDHATATSQVSMNAVNYLNSLRPNEAKKSPLDSKPVVNAAQKAKYDNALNIAEQPLVVLHKIQQGQLTSEDIATLSTIYPALYSRLKDKMMAQVVNMEHKDKIIPYKTRTALSLFMGTPLDSTMTPMAIQSIQGSSQSGKQAQQQSAPQGPKRSTSSLSKLPGTYKTPDQTAEGRRNREH